MILGVITIGCKYLEEIVVLGLYLCLELQKDPLEMELSGQNFQLRQIKIFKID
jgi:hypothetical protein